MKKSLLSFLFLSSLITSPTQTYIDQSNIGAIGVVAGITATVGTMLYGIGKFIGSFFSAKAYYDSARTGYNVANLTGIYSIRSFEDLTNVIKHNLYYWDHILLSDCYVIEIYHFLGNKLTELNTAQRYVMTAYHKSNNDRVLQDMLESLDRNITQLHNQYMYLRSMCEYHPLFNQHMFIYREKENLRLEKERILQERMNAANIADAIRENAQATREAAKKEETVIINNTVVINDQK